MPATVSINMMSAVHKASTGITTAFPDVCKTPSPGGPVPIPYPNVAMSTNVSKGAKKVTFDRQPACTKDSVISMSTGDEAGSAGGGVACNKIKGKAEFVAFSPNVKIEGKNAVRALDLMLHNDKNTPPFPIVQPPVLALP